MRFPKYHLATSVVNRILNVADQVQAIAPASAPPQLPDPTRQGQALDQALATPVQPVVPPEGTAEQVAIENVQGGSAADAIGASAIMDAMQ